MKYVKIAGYEAEKKEVKRVLLLFSGGLDTSIAIKWLKENYNAEVITFTANIGQPTEDIEGIKEKALMLGAKKAYVMDLREEFVNNYIAPAIKANGLYQSKYPLSTALSRYVIVEHAVKLADKIGADSCAHGSTGKGNSQVRFDLAITILNPRLKVVAPIREWGITRDKELKYAKKHHIPVPVSSQSIYSIDENLWGRGIASGPLEDPEIEPSQEILKWITPPEKAPNTPEYITLEFEEGLPVSLNSKKMSLTKIIMKLNIIAGKHGVGIIDHVEDRVIGLKSHDYYECPAALTIIEAHKDLEKFTSTIHQNNFKDIIDSKWTQLAYSGLWYDPLCDALRAFIDKANERVTGWVRIKLYKGMIYIVGRGSPYALYNKKMTTYMTGEAFNRQASTGFIELFGLQTKLAYNQNIHLKK